MVRESILFITTIGIDIKTPRLAASIHVAAINFTVIVRTHRIVAATYDIP